MSDDTTRRTRDSLSDLLELRPRAHRKALIRIENVQLRDLVQATERPGEVLSVRRNAVVSYDMRNAEKESRTLATLRFTPTTMAYAAPEPGFPRGTVVVGGDRGKLAIFAIPVERKQTAPPPTIGLSDGDMKQCFNLIAHGGTSIVNSVAFVPNSQTAPSSQRRLLVSGNDCVVQLLQIAPLLSEDQGQDAGVLEGFRISKEAAITYAERMNHASISPDGRLLIAAGDAPHLHLHEIPNSAHPRCKPKPIFTIPTTTASLSRCGPPTGVTDEAIFSTAFSHDGLKFAAGSQDGVVQVWDVRSLKTRLALFRTASSGGPGTFALDGNVHDTSAALGKSWGIRTLRFSPSTSNNGRELLVFSEHHARLHFVDARTFDSSPESWQTLDISAAIQRWPVGLQEDGEIAALRSMITSERGEEPAPSRGIKRARGSSDGEEFIPRLRRRRETVYYDSRREAEAITLFTTPPSPPTPTRAEIDGMLFERINRRPEAAEPSVDDIPDFEELSSGRVETYAPNTMYVTMGRRWEEMEVQGRRMLPMPRRWRNTLYRHSNLGTTSLPSLTAAATAIMTDRRPSASRLGLPNPMFTLSPEPLSPLLADHDHDAFARGSPPPFDWYTARHSWFEDEEEYEAEAKTRDVAGFAFGIDGTASAGSLYVGIVGSPSYARLLEYSLSDLRRWRRHQTERVRGCLDDSGTLSVVSCQGSAAYV